MKEYIGWSCWCTLRSVDLLFIDLSLPYYVRCSIWYVYHHHAMFMGNIINYIYCVCDK